MFGRKRITELETRLAHLIAASEEVAKRAVLVDIVREGRVNKFIFMRQGKLFTVETMGLISDDIVRWKKDLLE